MGLDEKVLQDIVMEAAEARRKARKHMNDIKKEVENHDNEQNEASKTNTKGIWVEEGNYFTRWKAALKYLEDEMPSAEDHKHVYSQLRYTLLYKTTDCDHDKLYNLLERYR